MYMQHRVLALVLLVTFTFPFSPLIADEETLVEDLLKTTTRTISVSVRHGATLIWSGNVEVPDSETATTSLIATDGTEAPLLAASALSVLVAADAAASEFSISHLQYYDSFDSFYVKCITATTEQCDNWQYVVNSTYPTTGMDQHIMQDDDRMFVYFGTPHRTRLSTSSIPVGENVVATAEHYVPESDTYAPLANVTIGATQPNPDDPYAPLVIATSTTNALGEATMTLSATGTYALGIAEDYYDPAVSLLVFEPSITPHETSSPGETQDSPESHGSSGGSVEAVTPAFNIAAALQYLADQQNADGSFATPLLTDWAAVAFAATPEIESAETRMKEFLAQSTRTHTNLTDLERRLFALMALDINPYSGTDTDYVARILAHFDGTQFGDPALVNDDIFAVIPLTRAGHSTQSDPVAKSGAFIVSKQRHDGSWDGNVDMTSAALQALRTVESIPGASDAIARGTAYLHSQQRADGGFGNSFSTSWALLAIHDLGLALNDWKPTNKNPEDFLATQQALDGGIEAPSTDTRTRTWATAYAIPAARGMPWQRILHSFEQPRAAVAMVATSTTMRDPLLYSPIIATSSALSASTAETREHTPVHAQDALARGTWTREEEPHDVRTPPEITQSDSELQQEPQLRHVAAAAASEPAGFIAHIQQWFFSILRALHDLFV